MFQTTYRSVSILYQLELENEQNGEAQIRTFSDNTVWSHDAAMSRYKHYVFGFLKFYSTYQTSTCGQKARSLNTFSRVVKELALFLSIKETPVSMQSGKLLFRIFLLPYLSFHKKWIGNALQWLFYISVYLWANLLLTSSSFRIRPLNHLFIVKNPNATLEEFLFLRAFNFVISL